MKKFFIDIETIPSENPPIGKKLKKGESEADQHRATSLDPDYGRILCIGYEMLANTVEMTRLGITKANTGDLTEPYNADDLIGYVSLSNEFYTSEKAILKEFWATLEGFHFDPTEDLLIGHNIIAFDLPFILKRSIINQVKPSVRLSARKYYSRPVYDTMQEWNSWNGTMIGLSRLAGILGLESHKPAGEAPTDANVITGANLYEAYQAGRFSEIASYCMADVELTKRVYQRMNFEEVGE